MSDVLSWICSYEKNIMHHAWKYEVSEIMVNCWKFQRGIHGGKGHCNIFVGYP